MKRMLLTAAAIFMVSNLSMAASIGPCLSRSICLSNEIQRGDAAQFAAVARNYPSGTYVWLSGPGGDVREALDIGDIIKKRGFSTVVSRDNGLCASACALLFLSGYHAIIERNSLLVFHEGAYAADSTPLRDEDADYIADRVVAWGGVTKRQIWILLHSAPPSGGRPGTEAWARQLGFQFSMVPSFLGMWQSCPSKFCVAF